MTVQIPIHESTSHATLHNLHLLTAQKKAQGMFMACLHKIFMVMAHWL